MTEAEALAIEALEKRVEILETAKRSHLSLILNVKEQTQNLEKRVAELEKGQSKLLDGLQTMADAVLSMQERQMRALGITTEGKTDA